jgi:RNA-directed DNA polymerase
MEKKQMTTKTTLIGASSPCDSNSWGNIPWKRAKSHVFRLQMRIAKATREGRFGKVKALQRILTHSFYSKCLAVKQITSNTGKNTPGIDGEIWRTNLQKIRAVNSIKRRGYKPLPLKRIYIPKKQSNKKRPLSIPVMKDRAMQAIWLLALYPVAEEKVDPNSYGFRAKRSAQDAIEQCFVALGRKRSAKFVLEGDIKSCFDLISHKWLLKNIPMDKVILQKFLKAQFMEDGKLYPVTAGIPQGGIISPCLTLITLSGLEILLKSKDERIRKKEKINFIAYADDFVITAATEELLNKKVIPIIDKFLAERGLELSKEKTKITHVEKGFDFLGFNIRKYSNEKMMIKPSKGNIRNFLSEIRTTIKSNIPLQTDKLIYLLNSKITGWSNYYKSVVSSEVFSMVDNGIYKALNSWAKHRHPNKGGPWITKKYFTRYGLSNWRFYSNTKGKDGKIKPVYLRRAIDTKIKRHVKIRGAATPFNPEFKDYLEARDRKVVLPDSMSLLGRDNLPY